LNARPSPSNRAKKTLRDVQIGPLRLNIRVDRVDRALGEGNAGQPSGEIILDYKTGPASPRRMAGRPARRATASASTPSSLMRHSSPPSPRQRPPRQDLGLHGYEARDGVLPKAAKLKAESLATQVEDWREVLTALAQDFHSGEALVDPKQYPQTCAHCDQRLLCRLDPTTLRANSLDEDSGTSSDSNLSGSSDSASLEDARG